MGSGQSADTKSKRTPAHDPTAVFWRMHHADLDFDVITALRFHSLEIVLSMGIKLVAVLIFEV